MGRIWKNDRQVLPKCFQSAQVEPEWHCKIKMGNQPRPKGPWENLQMDFTGPLPRKKGKIYCLVIIDQFTRWVEAFPCKGATAKTVTLILGNEIIPWWGMQLQLDSDQGTHFTGRILIEICQMLGIKQRFHIPYYPRSSGMVERMNRKLKNNLTQAILDKGNNRVQVLSAILLWKRATPAWGTGLTSFELITGGAMHLPEEAIKGGGELEISREQYFNVWGIQ